jgi:hypothetical protein
MRDAIAHFGIGELAEARLHIVSQVLNLAFHRARMASTLQAVFPDINIAKGSSVYYSLCACF